MSNAAVTNWIDASGITLDPENPGPALDSFLQTLSPDLEILALGEPTHGEHAILKLRNRIFKHLAENHGFTAIAIESSFPRGPLINDFIRAGGDYALIEKTGFSHGVGAYPSNRELVEQMRTAPAPLIFYGFDAPTEYAYTDSPRALIEFLMNALHAPAKTRDEIETLLGPDAPWENPAANFDHTKSIGRSPSALALKTKIDELYIEFQNRRREFDPLRLLEAMHYFSLALGMLHYHAAVAMDSDNRLENLLALRDAMMAANLGYINQRNKLETGGRLFVFAHNAHLQTSPAQWNLGGKLLRWRSAGDHTRENLKNKYAAIATALGNCPQLGLSSPEPGTLEHFLTARGSPLLIPTQNTPATPFPPRSSSNPGYFPFTSQSVKDFDALALL